MSKEVKAEKVANLKLQFEKEQQALKDELQKRKEDDVTDLKDLHILQQVLTNR